MRHGMGRGFTCMAITDLAKVVVADDDVRGRVAVAAVLSHRLDLEARRHVGADHLHAPPIHNVRTARHHPRHEDVLLRQIDLRDQVGGEGGEEAALDLGEQRHLAQLPLVHLDRDALAQLERQLLDEVVPRKVVVAHPAVVEVRTDAILRRLVDLCIGEGGGGESRGVA